MARKERGGKSFQQVAVESRLVSDEQVKQCLQAQDEERTKGGAVTPLEDLLLRKGFMTEDQIRAVKTALDRYAKDEEKGEPVRIGNYEIIGKIGDGGLGTVYKARQISMSREVALKVLHKKWLNDEEFKKRFLLEFRLAGRLSHQNLVQVFDAGKDRVLYFVMEFVDGETVEDMIEREGAIDIPKGLDITIQILRAIAYIKRHDIVHRDIKPGNIMLTRSGIAKLGDFGFVKYKLESAIATEGEVLGTPDYISPEQAMGSEHIDWRSDQYSLGCTLYHMLTGKPPFEGSGSSVMRQHIKADLPDPRTINPKIPDAVCHILERMLAKDPNDRYQSVDDLFEDVELVKMGQVPSSARLDAGKSTIIRAFKIEKSRAQRAKSELEILREEVKRLRFLLKVTVFAVGFLILIVIFVSLFAGPATP